MLNLRNLSLEEIETRNYAQPSADFGNELFRRVYNGDVIDEEDAQRKLDDATEKAFEDGCDDGMRNERDLIVDSVCDSIVFHYANKIEADVIDDLVARIRSDFPPLPRRET